MNNMKSHKLYLLYQYIDSIYTAYSLPADSDILAIIKLLNFFNITSLTTSARLQQVLQIVHLKFLNFSCF